MNNQIEACAGETVYSFLERALWEARDKKIYFKATHNGISIFVHPKSCIEDLCDKYALQRMIDETDSY